MAHQTVLNDTHNPTAKSRPNGLMSNVGSFGNDLASLATLQTKLAAADMRESLQKAAPAIGGLVVLSLLAIAGMTAIIAGFAMWLAEALNLRLGVALMLTGLGCVVLVRSSHGSASASSDQASPRSDAPARNSNATSLGSKPP